MGNFRIQLCIFIIAVLFSSSSWTTNHGLMWGVEEGDRLDYIIKIGYNPRQIELDEREIQFDLRIYIEINELLNLSEPIADSSIWYVTNLYMDADIFLKNGTSLTAIDSSVSQLLDGASAIPLGNWSLLNEILDTTNEDLSPDRTYTAIDDTDYWGYFFEDSFMNSSETWKWRKTDGSLHSVNVVNSSHERLPSGMALDFSVERIGQDQGLLIYLGLGGGIIVVAALVLFLRKR